MEAITRFLRTLGTGRLVAMGTVALILTAFFAALIFRYENAADVPLYAGLSLEDSAAIADQLTAQNIPFTLREGGSAILVPAADAPRLRMELAGEGLPSGGVVGYEIFDKADTLGTTSFVQNINQLRALEGELARTIRTIRRVENARVHLVLPERQLFRRDAEKPTASIVLRTRGSLDGGQIRAIQHLVAAAVPGLEPSRISLVDEAGRLLAAGTGSDTAVAMGTDIDERTVAFQTQVEDRIRDIVESVVGVGRARVRVAAELDFNRISETRDIFDPEGQVVRSTQTREESAASSENTNDQVTVGNQIPNANAAETDQQPQVRDDSSSTEEVVNYEISKTTRTAITEMGSLKRLSVAVLVDGRYATDANGVQAYTPRSQEELEQIAVLVRSAMGFDQERGDQVEVVNLPFAQGPAVEEEFTDPGIFDVSEADIIRLVELTVMMILALLVLIVGVRPLIRRILEPEMGTLNTPLPGQTITGPGGVTMVIGSDGIPIPPEPPVENRPPQIEGPAAQRIEEAKALGAAQFDQIRRVGELVQENPNEASIIIRNWLSEAA